MTNDSAEKEFEPSERKLTEARRKGDIPISRDLLAAAAMLGLFASIMVAPEIFILFLSGMSYFISSPDALTLHFSPHTRPNIPGLAAWSTMHLLPIFILPTAFTVAALVAQRAISVTPSKIAPSIDKISPISGLKKRFSINAIIDFLKGNIKLLIISYIIGSQINANHQKIISSYSLTPINSLKFAGELLMSSLTLYLLTQFIIGLLDFIWQKYRHKKNLMMSRTELLQELKQSDGDPHFKAARQRKAEEIAANTMIKNIENASVIIVNPEHYAIALQWVRQSGKAPICIAKGVDDVAARIRHAAKKFDIPIKKDPPIARALWHGVKIGEEIRPEHYRAVAAAIRFDEQIRKVSL